MGVKAVVVGTVLLALALSLLLPGTPAFAFERKCGSVQHRYKERDGKWERVLASEIVGSEIGCAPARKVARAYASRSIEVRTNLRGERRVRSRFPRAVGRFRCEADYVGSDLRDVSCRDGEQVVTFNWYDSSGWH